MKLSKNAEQLLNARYLLKNIDGKVVESPEALFRRVAQCVASAENKDAQTWEDRFYTLLTSLQFLPNSPTLMNAGLPNGQLSACFVLPVEDSLSSIFTTLKDMALIHQSGGGTGYNFSQLRPQGDLVSSSGGVSSGPLAFIKIYDTATEHVRQGGKRRGANMGILNVDHPDIEAFIISKSQGNILQNFNLSVGITDDFMHAVGTGSDWKLINPRTKKVAKIVKATVLWDKIVEQAWATGDPGLIFLDAMNRHNPVPKEGRIQSTNPCGEVPLFDYESCNLGSINLSKIIKIDGEQQRTVDWDKLDEAIAVAMRFLDNIVSINHYLLPQIAKATKNNRKVGLGVMGWAEMLALLNIPYASEEAISLGEKIMHFVRSKSYKASAELAEERGTFPNWEKSIFHPHEPMRNATCNSIAPTGSISVIAGTSYSIEPLYALAYKRVGILGDQTQMEINPVFVDFMQSLGLWTDAVKTEVLDTGGIQALMDIPAHIRKVFQTSLDIHWKYHLKHQQAFQRYTDNAVSKTINLAENASKETVSDIYMTAWKYELKGITIYRDGSKANQVLQACHLNKSSNC
ncbi:adenosylcobalamin-dependent ribonucleoside-diphosphate reductase [Muricauda sp. 334s03]|uniref:Vitamin B12-dependent ribonucleotide reductase n=1 Tax=Flagellimonas yonaguniensis TaxID=3031325 RepID=A0ABT5XWE7_9FLAO|nr:adenosylcobalamin-dependent ribonucleoside-diphosphate reductase [[Muricauda] yonaguniensis]MDF0715408.1 adenosylcobalamin-dependent ribonucleoside-diphosphate reductase [[Muricauda] yonaguniensis]